MNKPWPRTGTAMGIPMAGGPTERLTQVIDLGSVGAFSPDGQHLAFASATGLYVMRPEGSALIQLLNAPDRMAVQWLP